MPSKIDRVGEIKIATNGQKMKIIEYESSENITVEFEDGTIVKNKRYSCFAKGNIRNPNFKYKTKVIPRNSEIWVGKKFTNKRNEEITIIEYNGALNVVIQFDNGVVKTASLGNLKNGNCSSADRNTFEELKEKYEGKSYLQKIGEYIKIVDYKRWNNIVVRFNDGFEKTTTITQILKGKVTRKTKYDCNFKHIGDRFTNKFGESFEIIGRADKDTVVVKFDNGCIRKTDSKRACNGSNLPSEKVVKNPSVKVGDEFDTYCGMKCKIKEYITSKNVTVEFEDGAEKKNVNLNVLKLGNVSHPKLNNGKIRCEDFHGYKIERVMKVGNDVYYSAMKNDKILGLFTLTEIYKMSEVSNCVY